LGAELSLDSQNRSRIFGYRQVLRTIGMFAGVTLGAYLVGTGRAGAAWVAWGLGLGLVVLVVGGSALLPPERSAFRGRGGGHPFRAIRDVFANEHARLLLFVFFVENIGAGGIGVLAPFVIEYVLDMGEAFVPALLAAYMVSALVAVPIWVRLGSRFEKRRLWLIAMIQGGAGFGLMLWVGEGDWILMLAAAIIAGSAGSCGSTLGYVLKAEVIDYDEYRTGERKEGAYFATWSFMSKLANGIMVGLGREPVAWLLETPWNNFFLMVVLIWLQVGFAMVILSAAIKAVPDDILEAARIDGANEWQVFWRVIIPSISSTLVVVLTTMVITVLKIFDIVWVMTNGENGTEVIAERMVRWFFRLNHNGRGAAIAVVLFVAIIPVMYFNVRRFRAEEQMR